MKKALALVLTLVLFTMALTACGQKEPTETTTTEVTETSSAMQDETTELTELGVIDMESFVNDMAGGRPVVKVIGDEGETLLSFDFSEKAITEVNVTLDKPVEDEYLYITMAGNVTKHSLVSDGSLFDGMANIVDGKAEFTVEYDGERVISFTIQVPKA